MPYCVKCGKELSGTAKFCSNCGVQVTPKIERDNQANQGTKQHRTENSKQDDKARLEELKLIRRQRLPDSHDQTDTENRFWDSIIEKISANLPTPSIGVKRLAVILFIIVCLALTIAMIVMGIVQDDNTTLWFSICPAVITIWGFSGLRTLKKKKRRKKK